MHWRIHETVSLSSSWRKISLRLLRTKGAVKGLGVEVLRTLTRASCEIFNMPPINSYHRLLAHKMAEYYRLTHVADSSGASVRMFRGEAARMYCIQSLPENVTKLMKNPVPQLHSQPGQ